MITHGPLTVAESTSILRYIGQLPGGISLKFEFFECLSFVFWHSNGKQDANYDSRKVVSFTGGEPWYGGLGLKDKIKVKKVD